MGLMQLVGQTQKIGTAVCHIPSITALVLGVFASLFTIVTLNILKQALVKRSHEPPLVFHWAPFVGNAVEYGQDPYAFLFECRRKHGDVFTFILLGKRMTVCLGTHGNDFILNGRLKDVNAEEVYRPLTAPVFGAGVVYDCTNSKLMEQKKFLKFGLTTEALHSYVPLITSEFYSFIKQSPFFRGSSGSMPITRVMAEITILTASRTLQGHEVRQKFDTTFADLYHDLDMGFTPINFILPWFPLPRNRKRDCAQRILSQTYIDIIKARRASGNSASADNDMIWNLMSAQYKDGSEVPDQEIAHMMIALLMAGQHSSSSTGSWIILRLASRPDIVEELYQEQIRVLGAKIHLPPTYEDIQRLALTSLVVKETLRLHSPIHSIMRAVKSPLHISVKDISSSTGDEKVYSIPTSHTLLSAPGVTAQSSEHFPNPDEWDPHRWEAQGEAANETSEKIDYGYGLVTKGARSPYLPFGAGRHRCIGEQFAYLQLATITALMVREFRFALRAEGGIPKTDYSSLFSRPMHPAMVRWERRTMKEESDGTC